MFNLQSCVESAEAGDLQEWILDYLSGGYWANPGLRTGLLLHERYWIGPLRIELSKLERSCGPEAEMHYQVPEEAWLERIQNIAADLTDAKQLPPIIVEWQHSRLIIRDGNHRHAAMVTKGWNSCFAVIWCNSEAERTAALSQLAASSPNGLLPG